MQEDELIKVNKGLDKQMIELACFGCEYKEDCEEDFDVRQDHCKRKYDEADCFWKNIFYS